MNTTTKFTQIPMQHFNLIHQKAHTSSKFDSTRNKLRQMRRSIFQRAHKSELLEVKIVPSPFTKTHIEWTRGLLSSDCDLEPFDIFESSSTTSSSQVMDGATERMFRRNQMSQNRQPQVSAIFVHAGAGYHSTTNEHIHLGACDRYVFSRPFALLTNIH
jgi:taspase (threonine aspartase 1)